MDINFSERYAQQANLLTRLDPRVKIGFCMICLLLLTSATRPLMILSLGLSLLTVLLFFRVSLGYICLRLLPGLLLTLVIMLTQFFITGHSVFLEVPLGAWKLVLYREGWEQGVLLGTRVFAGLMVMIFLSSTTTISMIIFALAWFRVPKPILEIVTVAYRYIFVLIEEIILIFKAQRIRLGYGNWHQSIKAVGLLGGMVIIRAFDRSERLYRSMCCRGYRGDLEVDYQGSFTAQDGIITVIMSTGLGVILLYGS